MLRHLDPAWPNTASGSRAWSPAPRERGLSPQDTDIKVKTSITWNRSSKTRSLQSSRLPQSIKSFIPVQKYYPTRQCYSVMKYYFPSWMCPAEPKQQIRNASNITAQISKAAAEEMDQGGQAKCSSKL